MGGGHTGEKVPGSSLGTESSVERNNRRQC